MDFKALFLEELETLYRLISDEEKETNEEITCHFENLKEMIEYLP